MRGKNRDYRWKKIKKRGINEEDQKLRKKQDHKKEKEREITQTKERETRKERLEMEEN